MKKADQFGKNLEEKRHLASMVFYRKWARGSSPKAILLIVHGLGEHSGRYKQLAEFFCYQDVVVVCPDHLGHGLSPGKRGHVRRFEDYLSTVAELCDELERDYPQIPCFVLGHSMGGLITATYLLENQHRFTGAMFSGAALRLAEKPSTLLRWVVDFLADFLPRVGVMKIDGSKISRDLEVVNAYINDPFVHHKSYSARLISEFIKAIEKLERDAKVISIPVLVMHGEADELADPEGSRDFFEKISTEDKTLNVLPCAYHEILNEPEGRQLISGMSTWINERL